LGVWGGSGFEEELGGDVPEVGDHVLVFGGRGEDDGGGAGGFFGSGGESHLEGVGEISEGVEGAGAEAECWEEGPGEVWRPPYRAPDEGEAEVVERARLAVADHVELVDEVEGLLLEEAECLVAGVALPGVVTEVEEWSGVAVELEAFGESHEGGGLDGVEGDVGRWAVGAEVGFEFGLVWFAVCDWGVEDGEVVVLAESGAEVPANAGLGAADRGDGEGGDEDAAGGHDCCYLLFVIGYLLLVIGGVW